MYVVLGTTFLLVSSKTYKTYKWTHIKKKMVVFTALTSVQTSIFESWFNIVSCMFCFLQNNNKKEKSRILNKKNRRKTLQLAFNKTLLKKKTKPKSKKQLVS